jgi:uncharacterized protein YidB (DUF937 family)
MGLLDGLAGQLLGAGDARHAGLLQAIGGLIHQQPGGLAGLIDAFERGGLGNVAASWIGTGANLPISADQLQSVLGSSQIESIARSLGFTPQEATGHLAELLPQVIDRLTPQGALPEAGALGGLLAALRR